jgi:glycosyltransferase involved in cell wall biosynthesis
MKTKSPLRVCLDARLISGVNGGVEQFVIGLASGLANLADGDEEYLFLCYQDADEWLSPYMQGRCSPLHCGPAPRANLKQWLKPLLPAASMVVSWLGQAAVRIQVSDGVIEQASANLMHFTTQSGFLTGIPSIYQPWDLQHLHLPEFFSRRERIVREKHYRGLCAQAKMVAVASTWTKKDVITHYRLPHEKICVIPTAPPNATYPIPNSSELELAKKKLGLPEAYIFYPAQTWPHKNHIKLLDAIAMLRNREGLRLALICSGKRNDFFPKIEQHIRKLSLMEQVKFLGFVTPIELQCLYRLSCGMVFPTKFEGCGLPLMEAFLTGTPVACSNVTSLPAQAGNAALIFDPDKPEEIAEALRSLWTDPTLRSALIERGQQRVAQFTWEKTARIFRAHYRRLSDRPLQDEDRSLLEAPPII